MYVYVNRMIRITNPGIYTSHTENPIIDSLLLFPISATLIYCGYTIYVCILAFPIFDFKK